jgi:transmembrane sensor
MNSSPLFWTRKKSPPAPLPTASPSPAAADDPAHTVVFGEAQGWWTDAGDDSRADAPVPGPESAPFPPQSHAYAYQPPAVVFVGGPGPSEIDAAGYSRAGRPAVAALVVLAVTVGLWWSFNSVDVVTGIGESRTVRLADGSSMQLDTDTAVDVAVEGRERRLDLVHGEIYVETAPAGARSLRIDAGIGQVQSSDGALSVRRDRDGTVAVAVERGQAEVVGGALAAPVLLQAGDRIRFDRSVQSGVQHGAAARALGWRQGQLTFEDEALIRVMDEVRRYDPRYWVLPVGAVAEARLSTVVAIDHIDHWLDALSDTLPLEIVRLGPTIWALERAAGVPAPDLAEAMR